MSVVKIDGRVMANAEPLQYTDGTCVVRVLIQMDCGQPVLAERSFGRGPAASFAASAAAQRMRKGCEVHAYGRGIKAGRYSNQAVLKLEAVDQIQPPSIPLHEPAVSAA